MNTGVSTVNQAIALDDTAESTLKKFAELKPTVPFPANSSQYSTIHFNAVAGVTQWVANQTLEDFLNAHIWGPAGMEAKMNALDAKATGRRGQAFSIEWDSSVACFIDLSKDVKYNESAACAGNATVFDYWSNGTTLEQQGGGSVLMTGEDMVCPGSGFVDI
jgi:CubicO group peptidase (beta-lactamase class C family)